MWSWEQNHRELVTRVYQKFMSNDVEYPEWVQYCYDHSDDHDGIISGGQAMPKQTDRIPQMTFEQFESMYQQIHQFVESQDDRILDGDHPWDFAVLMTDHQPEIIDEDDEFDDEDDDDCDGRSSSKHQKHRKNQS